MTTPLSAQERAAVVQQAQEIAARQGITPEQALYNYAQQNGIDPAGVDTYMGFTPGTTQNWAVQNGQLAAPQGHHNTGQSAPAPVPDPAPAPSPASGQPLGADQRASVVQHAQDIATKYGISPEMALWNYANQNGIDPAGIDSYMGFAPGTSSDWAAKNGVGGSPSKNLGMGGLPAALGADQRAAVIAEATRRAQSNASTPESELYRYAQGNKLSNADVDAYMGFGAGSTDAWLKANGNTTPPGALTATAPAAPAAGALTTAAADYKMPVLNALYQGQQQRMLAPAPTFNFQQQPGAMVSTQPAPQPGFAAGAPQPGALTTAISAP